jgi:hypothetical protein
VAENVAFTEEWMAPLNTLQAQNTTAMRRFFDQVPLTDNELNDSASLPLNSPISVAEALRILPLKLFALPSKLKNSIVKILNEHPLYTSKRYTCTSELVYSPFQRLQLVLNDLGSVPSDPDALLTRTLTSTVLFSLSLSQTHSFTLSYTLPLHFVSNERFDVDVVVNRIAKCCR